MSAGLWAIVGIVVGGMLTAGGRSWADHRAFLRDQRRIAYATLLSNWHRLTDDSVSSSADLRDTLPVEEWRERMNTTRRTGIEVFRATSQVELLAPEDTAAAAERATQHLVLWSARIGGGWVNPDDSAHKHARSEFVRLARRDLGNARRRNL